MLYYQTLCILSYLPTDDLAVSGSIDLHTKSFSATERDPITCT